MRQQSGAVRWGRWCGRPAAGKLLGPQSGEQEQQLPAACLPSRRPAPHCTARPPRPVEHSSNKFATQPNVTAEAGNSLTQMSISYSEEHFDINDKIG